MRSLLWNSSRQSKKKEKEISFSTPGTVSLLKKSAKILHWWVLHNWKWHDLAGKTWILLQQLPQVVFDFCHLLFQVFLWGLLNPKKEGNIQLKAWSLMRVKVPAKLGWTNEMTRATKIDPEEWDHQIWGNCMHLITPPKLPKTRQHSIHTNSTWPKTRECETSSLDKRVRSTCNLNWNKLTT